MAERQHDRDSPDLVGVPRQSHGPPSPDLTGAEATAMLLKAAGVRIVFGYPGTSELALCESLSRLSGVRLVSARGDKESVFMAAGASLLRSNRGAAVVHGARGLTNAAGAVAAARRNEIGTVVVVGLPSTTSAGFLPPHAEPDLISGVGSFAGWWWEAPAVPAAPADRRRAAEAFVRQLLAALSTAARLPARPSIFGIPQDVAEARWIPPSILEDAVTALGTPGGGPAHNGSPGPAVAPDQVVQALREACRPLFLVDDYALRYPGFRTALDELAGSLGAPVLQLRYRRGPMLFERLRREEVGNFVGWFNPFSAAHTELLDECDLLVTVEDRNLYRRVVGDLPPCRKLAINTDASKARKNRYLRAGDLLVEGDPVRVLRQIADGLRRRSDGAGPRRARWFAFPPPTAATANPEYAGEAVERMRTALVGAVAHVLGGWERPVLVDDSQMFGGLISERYDLLPAGTRVFGDHSGFVGGGLATATGLALGDPAHRVLCTLGDQGFGNALQCLVPAAEANARLVVLVCNNGESVSLRKQATASLPGYRGGPADYLTNSPRLCYRRVAEAFGAATWLVEVDPGADDQRCGSDLRRALREAAAAPGPALVELKLPSDPDFWRGIWITQGLESARHDEVSTVR